MTTDVAHEAEGQEMLTEKEWEGLLVRAVKNGYEVMQDNRDAYEAVLRKDGRYFSLDATGIPTELDDNPFDTEDPIVAEAGLAKAEPVAFASTVLGIPKELVIQLGREGEQRAFITQAGLLLKAERKGGYRAMYSEITGEVVENGKVIGYEATGYIFPHISSKEVEIIELLPALALEVQTAILGQLFKPFKAVATATTKNVKMVSMHTYLKELACTRALNRALRLYTACGFTSLEEMPEYDSKAELVD